DRQVGAPGPAGERRVRGLDLRDHFLRHWRLLHESAELARRLGDRADMLVVDPAEQLLLARAQVAALEEQSVRVGRDGEAGGDIEPGAQQLAEAGALAADAADVACVALFEGNGEGHRQSSTVTMPVLPSMRTRCPV